MPDGGLVPEENELRVFLTAQLQTNGRLGQAGVTVDFFVHDDQAFAVGATDHDSTFTHTGKHGISCRILKKGFDSGVSLFDIDNGSLDIEFHRIVDIGLERENRTGQNHQGQGSQICKHFPHE